jgi:serine/threonine protein phosphatase PrpC
MFMNSAYSQTSKRGLHTFFPNRMAYQVFGLGDRGDLVTPAEHDQERSMDSDKSDKVPVQPEQKAATPDAPKPETPETKTDAAVDKVPVQPEQKAVTPDAPKPETPDADSDITAKLSVEEIRSAVSAETTRAVTQEVGWVTDRGMVRSNNEDSLAAVTLNEATNNAAQSVGLYAVADGMGGHEAGEVASKIAVRTVIRKLMEEVTVADENLPENYQNWLKSAVALANQIIYNKANETNKSMGTTLVLAVVVGRDVHIVNVGDSRAYVISPTSIRQVTHDHSFVQALVDSGAISQKEANEHPRRNILTQSVGAQEELTIDLYNETLGSDEWLLLCSDGLWDMLSNEEIGRIVRSASSPSEACQALVDATNAAGGHDNIAAVLVRLASPPPKAEKTADGDDTLILPTPAQSSES